MKKLGLILIPAFALFTTLIAQQSEFPALKSEAEKYYAEGSYAHAHELYKQADALTLAPEDALWVDFRLADTQWRAHAATQSHDPQIFENAKKQLENLINREDSDLISAEANESLGDFYWIRRDSRNWHAALPNYQQALDWWAGSDQIETARRRYLAIVQKMAQPPLAEPHYYYGYYGNHVPIQILDNALRISETETERAYFHYLLAMTLRSQNDPQERAMEEFELAIAIGKSSESFDDALFHYGQYLEQKSQFVEALKIYSRLTTEFSKGETRYFDQAHQQAANIQAPSVDVRIANLFLPESVVEYHVSWRNIETIDFALYKVDLIEGSNPVKGTSWADRISISGKTPVRSWRKALEAEQDHKPHQETVKLDFKPGMGAYILSASSGSVQSRDLLLITDATLITKTTGSRILLYFADAANGAPIPHAPFRVWQQYYKDSTYQWREQSGNTDKDGLAVVEFPKDQQTNTFLASVVSGDRQAFSNGQSYGYSPHPEWRIYAFTDRPAYRPGEEVQWKFIARQYDGTNYSTPSNQLVEYEIYDPRGSKIKEGKPQLNSFGSAWDMLSLTMEMPLGPYRINFYDQNRKHIGQASLFRLEEYKLPEFQVSVRTPEENGIKKTFLLGEKIQAEIHANYYFGGAVSNATVEAIVYQNPYYPRWYPPQKYPWYYESIYPTPYRYYGGGQTIYQTTLKTDANGKALLQFDTPRNSQQDFEYRIEARVTDASRREITGSDTVRATRQRYYVYAHPAHSLYKPGDQVTIEFKTIDANQQAVRAEGMVKVTRDSWYEIWIKDGKEKRIARGDERPDLKGWTLKFQGYEQDEILKQTLTTNSNGTAELKFTPQQTGYYRIEWSSTDTPKKSPIQTQTAVWITTNATNELGYWHGGIQIIADQDTFHAGKKAAVMLSVPTSQRYVLFSIEGEDLYSYQVVRMDGTVKLMEIDIQEKHVPNVFLNATLVSDFQMSVDTKEIIVPPVQQFLDVQVKADRDEYQPREEGTLTVLARDSEGKPVSAEIALGLSDESVTYIQSDYAGDPRQFFYGTKRRQLVNTQSLYHSKTYNREMLLRDYYDFDAYDQAQLRSLGYVGGKLEGRAQISGEEVHADSVSNVAPASPPPPPLAEKSAAASPAEEPVVQVRSDFRSTAFWQPDIVTDQQGRAVVKVKYPDSLTSWNAVARVASATSQFGTATINTRTKKPLIVRLQAPRFFVAGDTVTISANINNNTDQTQSVRADLKVEGLEITNNDATVTVPANEEKRIDWIARVIHPGQAKITVSARSAKYADAMEKAYTIYDHGIEKFIARSGKVRGNDVTVRLDLPSQRRSTEMTVQVTPSMAVTMLDALPYLIDYPYGCTEQTMSRFLPSVITARTLKDLGLPADHIFETGGIEKQTADKTHPGGRKSLRQLPEIVRAGLNRLYDFQHGDGGWGWWKEGESDHFMTAYVVWGFSLAKNAGVEVRSDSYSRAVNFLQKELVEEEEHLDMQAWMLHAISNLPPSSFEQKAFENLWKNRDRLNAYTRALLALSAHAMGRQEEARILIRNLENGVKIDSAPDRSILIGGTSHESVLGTAHWGEDGIYWRWSDGGVEATAFALKALLAIDPQNKLIEPVTNWLIRNRRGAQWSSTRDTAIVVLALNDYLRTSGELQTDLEFELLVNDRSIGKQKISRENIFDAPSLFVVRPELIRDRNEIRIRKTGGSGSIYFAAQSKFFSMEEPITAAGNEIFVKREYFKLVGKPTLLKGYVYEKQPLPDLGSVKSGDRVQVVIQIEAKNHYEYLIFEDLKPAGLEAVSIRSGEPLYANETKSGRTQWVYQELRDRKVALFIDKLPEGIWQIQYDLRVESPGEFHALPLLGYAMYVPEIRANSEEIRLSVTD
jgi:uncharacterized protein YfaS (alpha-2-macroglobulin family)/tetratricopeptide (TPR) repeat protein